MPENKLKPFLRLAGGKQGLVKHLTKYLPENIFSNDRTYFEPFLGAGSLFFELAPKRAVLSDMNFHLINCFISIKENPSLIYKYSLEHKRKSSEVYYYQIRKAFNQNITKSGIAQAARFLYLNRTCFNGIFRVNRSGKFNVPYGHKENLCIPNLEQFIMISNLLRNVKLTNCSYENIIDFVRKGDFIYLDPPYPPLNGTSYFTHYTKDRFEYSDQQKLKVFANTLSKTGCYVMISNADIPIISELYKKWNIHKIETTRYVTSKAKKHKVGELIITNY